MRLDVFRMREMRQSYSGIEKTMGSIGFRFVNCSLHLTIRGDVLGFFNQASPADPSQTNKPATQIKK